MDDCILVLLQVYIIFHDKNGNKSKEFKLDNILKNDFERGHTDTFRISDIGGDLVDVSMIEIWRDGLFDDNLFLDLVVVNRLNSGESYDFPINRWIPREQHLFIRSATHLSIYCSRKEKGG